MAKSKLFIFKTNSLSNDQYLLKLNRTDSCLEVYSKVSNSKLNEYYSIRPDLIQVNIRCLKRLTLCLVCLVAKNHLLLMEFSSGKSI